MPASAVLAKMGNPAPCPFLHEQLDDALTKIHLTREPYVLRIAGTIEYVIQEP